MLGGRSTWYQELPKIELHVHLEGAIPLSGLFELVQKYGGDPCVPNMDAFFERFRFKNFSQFIETWSWKNQFLREYEDFTYMAELTARDMAGQNIRYAEMFFSPSSFSRQGLEVQEITRAVRKGLTKVPGIDIALIADLVRDYGPESELITLNQLNEVIAEGVVGIGIGGSEQAFPPGPFRSLFEEARRMGFRVNAHAGEAAGPESIWDAIRSLRPDRIGHGTRAHEDPSLVDYLKKAGVAIEACPISNLRTGIVHSLQNHPIREYFDRGLLVSVNTDDPKMFDTALDKEYESLVDLCGFAKKDICQLILLGIKSSWLSDVRKEQLASEFVRNPSWITFKDDKLPRETAGHAAGAFPQGNKGRIS